MRGNFAERDCMIRVDVSAIIRRASIGEEDEEEGKKGGKKRVCCLSYQHNCLAFTNS